MSFVFTTTKSIINHPHAAQALGKYCHKLGISNLLIVTDPGIVNLGMHTPVLKGLDSDSIKYQLFSDVQADPPVEVIERAISFAREHDINGVVGLGGGSSLDTAKLISALVNSAQCLTDVMGIDQITQPRLPLIQIPTTAGTGSEVTPISIVTTVGAEKVGIVSDVLLPDIAVLDPALTLKLPPNITAYTGIDAMVHAIEAYTGAIKKNPYSDMLAKESLAIMSKFIQTAVHHGADLEARNMMMLGATLAGQAFANSPVAAVHALAYPLGGHFHIPHGLSNSLVLPHVMRFNMPMAAELYAELADVILPNTSQKASLSNHEKGEALINHMEYLIDDLDLPKKLENVGVRQGDLKMLAEDASKQQRLLVNNPRTLDKDTILSIYQAAL